MLEVLHNSRGYYFYTLQERPDFLLCARVVPPGRGRPAQEFDSKSPAFIIALREFLLDRKILLRSGGEPVFRFGARTEQPYTDDQTRALLTTHMCFGHQRTTAPLTLSLASEASDLDRYPLYELASVVENAAVNALGERLLTLLPLKSQGGYSGLLVSPDDVPELGARLRWPMCGELPASPAFEVPPPPPPPAQPGYPHIKDLFSTLWLDPISHQRLYMFLLGCFDSSYLTHSVPLLSIDSVMQGMAKSEAAEAVANVLHGYRTPSLSPPRTPVPDQLASHFGAGHLVAILDNLDGVVDWSFPWLASVLTQRGAAERLRYEKASTNFRGRSAILTLVFGRATLHDDLVSRCWRVQIHGTTERWRDGPPKHFAKDYALEHRDALVSELYHAMLRGREYPVPVVDRCTVFAARAAGAYREVFGVTPALTDGPHRAMLSSLALSYLSRQHVEFHRRPVRVDTPAGQASYETLVGGTALGVRVTESGVVPLERV